MEHFDLRIGKKAFIQSTLILLALMVGGSFALLNGAGVMRALVSAIIRRMGGNKYRLMSAVILCFMLFGALLGLFEEVVPLVPIMIALAYLLGWEDLTERQKYSLAGDELTGQKDLRLQRAVAWFTACLALIFLVIVSSSFVEGLSDLTLPLVGILFLAGGLGAGLLGGMSFKEVLSSFGGTRSRQKSCGRSPCGKRGLTGKSFSWTCIPATAPATR